jgi:hypothetical protein
MNLDSGSDLLSAEAGEYAWDVPTGWLQGRGAWGGLVVAAEVKAAQQSQDSVDPARRVRNISACSAATVNWHRKPW